LWNKQSSQAARDDQDVAIFCQSAKPSLAASKNENHQAKRADHDGKHRIAGVALHHPNSRSPE
jgi:hypothetical protein